MRGFTFFYPLVEPGQPVDGFDDLQGRYSIPRPQNTEVCVSHNGSVLPTKDGRHLYVQAFYQGGNSFYDFTNPAAPQELGFADLEDSLGKADSWSTYWYNGTVFVNGGLNRRGATENRGFEAYAIDCRQRADLRQALGAGPTRRRRRSSRRRRSPAYPGPRRVPTRRASSAIACSRSLNFCTLPVIVIGNSLTKCTSRGTL